MTKLITKKSLDFAYDLSYEKIPKHVIEMMKMYVFDLLASAVAGTRSDKVKAVFATVTPTASNDAVKAFGINLPLTIRDAGLVNGMCGHALETDDSDRTGLSHPGVMVITPALLVSSIKNIDAKEFLTACVAGYEVMLRVGTALGLEHYECWHTTSTSGVLGAAVSAGKLLKLNREEFSHAFGNAGTLACGLWEFNQTHALSKILHVGACISNALLCVELAKHGFTGADRILEGEQGMFAGFNRKNADFSVFDDYGEFWRAGGVSFKPYPCCRHTHGGIDAAIELHKKISLDEIPKIAEIEIETYEAAARIVQSTHITNAAEAKFSLPYTVIQALLSGEISEESFSKEKINDSRMQELLTKVDLHVADDIEAIHPHHEQSRVTLRFADGKAVSAFIPDPLGEPENPVSWEMLKRKAQDETNGILRQDVFEELYTACRNLENTDNMRALYEKIQKETLPRAN